MTIQVLSEQVAAKIAAGEVVERPASVVKELIENSLDAGASQIIIEVRGGGVNLIRVVDNGAGIPPGEVELAFQRHATSKLTSAEDLERIATLGFRGEALPSIAAVSRVHLATRGVNMDQGWEISVQWGQVKGVGPHGCPPGTSIAVADLFENVPARRKFLRSPDAEGGRISDLISRYVMVFPEVRFHLMVGGRDSLSSPGSGRLEEALAVVYGGDVARAMLQTSWQDPAGGYRIEGYVSPPSLSRSNRSHISFFVNRRWVQSRPLSIALEEAYHALLPQGRHPLAVLNITVPYNDVDVNVHPTKREVRFRQQDRVFAAVQRTVRSALIAFSPVPQIHLDPRVSGPSLQVPFPTSQPAQSRYSGPSSAPQRPGAGPAQVAPLLRVLGQMSNTYVVAEGADGLFLIDQHAAHERVMFEKVLREVIQGEPSVQALLEPVTVELPPPYWGQVDERLKELESYGFLLEPFGQNVYLLRAVPSIFGGSDAGKALLEVLDLVARETRLKDRREVLAASIACHGAIRAGMGLSQEEMDELVALLESADNPHTCPHGRPTMVHLSSGYLEREFGRR